MPILDPEDLNQAEPEKKSLLGEKIQKISTGFQKTSEELAKPIEDRKMGILPPENERKLAEFSSNMAKGVVELAQAGSSVVAGHYMPATRDAENQLIFAKGKREAQFKEYMKTADPTFYEMKYGNTVSAMKKYGPEYMSAMYKGEQLLRSKWLETPEGAKAEEDYLTLRRKQFDTPEKRAFEYGFIKTFTDEKKARSVSAATDEDLDTPTGQRIAMGASLTAETAYLGALAAADPMIGVSKLPVGLRGATGFSMYEAGKVALRDDMTPEQKQKAVVDAGLVGAAFDGILVAGSAVSKKLFSGMKKSFGAKGNPEDFAIMTATNEKNAFTHYSSKEGLKELDPAFQGTGMAGSEKKIIENYKGVKYEGKPLFPGKTYVYGEGQAPKKGSFDESIFGEGKKAGKAYTGKLPEKVLDSTGKEYKALEKKVEAEVAGLVKNGKIQAAEANVYKTALVDRRAAEAGYGGIRYAEGTTLFGKAEVSDAVHNLSTNVKANKNMAEELKAAGYQVEEASGYWKGKPQGASYIVRGISNDEAVQIAKKYGQDAILTNKGLVYADGTIVKAKGVVHGDAAKKMEGYTVKQNGEAFSFVLEQPETKSIKEIQVQAKKEMKSGLTADKFLKDPVKYQKELSKQVVKSNKQSFQLGQAVEKERQAIKAEKLDMTKQYAQYSPAKLKSDMSNQIIHVDEGEKITEVKAMMDERIKAAGGKLPKAEMKLYLTQLDNIYAQGRVHMMEQQAAQAKVLLDNSQEITATLEQNKETIKKFGTMTVDEAKGTFTGGASKFELDANGIPKTGEKLKSGYNVLKTKVMNAKSLSTMVDLERQGIDDPIKGAIRTRIYEPVRAAAYKNAAYDEALGIKVTATHPVAEIDRVFKEALGNNKPVTFELSVGKVQLTPENVVAVRMYAKRANGIERLKNFGWNEDDIMKIVSSPTAQLGDPIENWFRVKAKQAYDLAAPVVRRVENKALPLDPNWIEFRYIQGQGFGANSSASLVKKLEKGVFYNPSLEKDFTVSAAEKSKWKLDLNLRNVMKDSLQNESKYAAWAETYVPVNQTMKMIESKASETAGLDWYKSMEKWLNDTAIGTRKPQDLGEKAVAYLRSAQYGATLGFKGTSVARQIDAFGPMADEIGWDNVARGIKYFSQNPGKNVQRALNAHIGMRTRFVETTQEEIVRTEWQAQKGLGKTLKQSAKKIAAIGSGPMELADQSVTSAGFIGAKLKYLSREATQRSLRGKAFSEFINKNMWDGSLAEASSEYAMRAVENTQAMTQTMFRPDVTRGGELTKLGFLYSSQQLMSANRMMQAGILKDAGKLSTGEYSKKLLNNILIPVTWSTAIGLAAKEIQKVYIKKEKDQEKSLGMRGLVNEKQAHVTARQAVGQLLNEAIGTIPYVSFAANQIQYGGDQLSLPVGKPLEGMFKGFKSLQSATKAYGKGDEEAMKKALFTAGWQFSLGMGAMAGLRLDPIKTAFDLAKPAEERIDPRMKKSFSKRKIPSGRGWTPDKNFIQRMIIEDGVSLKEKVFPDAENQFNESVA